MNYLAQKLLTLRKHYHYSQRFVADFLDIDVLEYMGFENGRNMMTFEQIKTIAKFYHISVMELFNNNCDVTLHDISSTKTDELNIEYFLPKEKFKDRFLLWVKKNPLICISSFLFVLVLVVFIFFVPKTQFENVSLKLENKNRLDASETSVVYINDIGVVHGSGDNSNGQLNLNFDNIVKVEEGSTFTIVLDDKGNLDSVGLMTRYADEIKRWKNIVDVSCGYGHVVALDDTGKVLCTGDNTFGQCTLDGTSDVKRVFATDRGSIVVLNDGSLKYCGEFFGRSFLNNHSDIIDIASSDNILVLLKANGKVEYYSNGKSYNQVSFFTDIIDIACGNDFIAALSSNGKVYIDIDNYLIEEEVNNWSDIIAIASGKDYLVAYDGRSIVGVGKNSYKQFSSSSTTTQYRLSQVKNIKAFVDENYVNIQFDEVLNADSYLIEVDIGTGFSTIIDDLVCVIDVSRFEDGKTYTISVTALGNGEYENSLVAQIEFTYHSVIKNESPSEDDNSVDIVEIPFSLDQLVGKTKTNFEIYLSGLGISSEQLNGQESNNICSGNEATIESVSGISDYELVTKEELKDRYITYTYCKVGE